MKVQKRNGSFEEVKFDKITKRIQRQCKDLKNVDAISIAQKVVQGVYDNVTSTLLDQLAIETAYSYSVRHPEYDKLAVRLAISALHKETPNTFSEAMGLLQGVKDSAGRPRPVLDEKVYKFIQKNAHILDAAIVADRDFLFDYFGYKTLAKSYLQKVERKIVERPQYMWMRVACGIHVNDIEAAIETYNMMSLLQATHATPSLFNSGTVKNQMSSCFLIQNKADSIDGIYSTLKDIALISQCAGGIGVSVHDIRSKGSPIYGTGGESNGLIPMLKVFAETANYVDQCFVGDTKVKLDSGLKCIENIQPGDLVKTSNTSERVLKKKEFDYSGEIVCINNDVKVTSEHIFMVAKDCAEMSDVQLRQALKQGLIELEWIAANELTKNDVIISKK